MSQLPVPLHHPDAVHRFFVFDAMDGDHYYFDSAAARDQYAAYLIGNYLDDGWDESVEQVMAGELTHLAQATNRVERPPADQLDAEGNDAEGRCWQESWAFYCDYELLPLPIPPAAPVDPAEPVQQLVAAGTLDAAVALYKRVLVTHLDQWIAGALDYSDYAVLRAQWETALLQTTRSLSRDPVAPAGQVAA